MLGVGTYLSPSPRIHLWPSYFILFVLRSPNISCLRGWPGRAGGKVLWLRRVKEEEKRDAEWRWSTEGGVRESVGDNLSAYLSPISSTNCPFLPRRVSPSSIFPRLASFSIWAPIAPNLFVSSWQRDGRTPSANRCAIMHGSTFRERAHECDSFFFRGVRNVKSHAFRTRAR